MIMQSHSKKQLLLLSTWSHENEWAFAAFVPKPAKEMSQVLLLDTAFVENLPQIYDQVTVPLSSRAGYG